MVTLDDGGTRRASKAQQWIWRHYQDYCKRVKELSKNNELWLLLNGDLVDGDHHQTPQIISRNMADQHKIALMVLKPLLDLNPAHIFVVRGTEAHTGKSAQWEEFIAKDIGAVPCNDEIFSWWHLMLDCEGVIFDIAHHGRAGYRPWTAPNAANNQAAELFFYYAERKERIPDVALRAHTHRKLDSYDNYPIRVIQIPGWQLATAYGHRIGAGKLLPIGGCIFKCRQGNYEVEKIYKDPPGEKPWKPSPKMTLSKQLSKPLRNRRKG